MIVRFHAIGRWRSYEVHVRWAPERRPRYPEIEKAIEEAWNGATAERQAKVLFDGPMCRLESFAVGLLLELELSATSYRIFWGTNLNNPHLAKQFGTDAMANPVGLSCALQSADGLLLLGKRNAQMAYYPLRIHPFAGSLEPAEKIDPFEEIRRELAEELKLAAEEIDPLSCAALIEDVSIGQPEMIFTAICTRSAEEIARGLDPTEHESLVAIQPVKSEVESALNDPVMTPIAVGTILLWGREQFGEGWFDAARRAVNLGES